MSDQKLSKKLHDDMVKLLKEQMPEHVCGFVKDRLAEADAMEARRTEQDEALERQAVEIARLQALKLRADKIEEQESDIYARNHTLQQDIMHFERSKKVYELEQQLAAQRAIAANTMTVNTNLTRNLEYRKILSGTVPVPVEGGNGCGGYIEERPLNQTTMETVD